MLLRGCLKRIGNHNAFIPSQSFVKFMFTEPFCLIIIYKKKRDTSHDTHCIKAGVPFWSG